MCKLPCKIRMVLDIMGEMDEIVPFFNASFVGAPFRRVSSLSVNVPTDREVEDGRWEFQGEGK